MKTVLFAVCLIVAVAGGTMYYSKYVATEPATNFKTSSVKHGDLLITINSTGTVEPQEVVDVGAQVQGKINQLGADPRATTDPRYKGKTIDYGSPVEETTELAFIDDSVYRAQRDQSKAALDRAKADLIQLEAKRDQAEAEWIRAQKLQNVSFHGLSGYKNEATGSPAPTIKGISDSDFILAKSNYQVAKANAEVGETAITQAEAALQLAETNLNYTKIKSPVKGTIIDRRVNIGQTVVASLNAPSLFLIAKDLRRMEVWASVNEADIGRIKLDMPVNFTVDTFPNETFHGQVSQIRFNATMNQNVVLYTVVISADNADMKLIPYLTADVKFEVDQRNDALLVPNSALTWQPRPHQIAPAHRDQASTYTAVSGGGERPSEGRKGDAKGGRGPGGSGKPVARAKAKETRGVLWVKDEEFVRPIEVDVGPSDGLQTEVSGPEVTEGLEVVTGGNREDRGADAKNPFAPQIFGGKRRGG